MYSLQELNKAGGWTGAPSDGMEFAKGLERLDNFFLSPFFLLVSSDVYSFLFFNNNNNKSDTSPSSSAKLTLG